MMADLATKSATNHFPTVKLLPRPQNNDFSGTLNRRWRTGSPPGLIGPLKWLHPDKLKWMQITSNARQDELPQAGIRNGIVHS